MYSEQILVSFYGDDFTGTTATAETLMESGLPTVVFTEPPSSEYLKSNFPGVKAVGISGIARTLPAHRIKQNLKPIFTALKSYQSPIYLYKVCSTFDSSNDVGNIGKAIELGIKLLEPEFVPVLPAAPRLKRFTVFGNQFAAMDNQNIFRLDQHPSISNHPITPMRDADMRHHLAQQTDLKIGLVNILDINDGPKRINDQINTLVKENYPIVIFDCLSEKNLHTISETLLDRYDKNRPLFLVGSQELGYGLGSALVKNRYTPKTPINRALNKPHTDKGPLLVLSGSCATVTGKQIKWSTENGFVEIRVCAADLMETEKGAIEKKRIIDIANQALAEGTSVVVHTAIGPKDDRIFAMRKKAAELSMGESDANELLGNTLGEITHDILECTHVQRLVIAGGDTTGRIQRYLRIKALQVSESIGMAAPLCYIYSKKADINGLEVAFKGGQIGGIDYFDSVRKAKTAKFDDIALGNV